MRNIYEEKNKDKCYVFTKDRFNTNYIVYNNKLESSLLNDYIINIFN